MAENLLPEIVESTAGVELEPEDAVARLGLVALSTDLTFERDAQRLIPPDRAALHVSRVANRNPATPENLARMAPLLTEAAALIVPGLPLAAICYACTSASVEIGEEAIDAAIHEARPGVPVVTPTRAAVWAFRALGVRRIALLTPYVIGTTRPMVAHFSRQGLELVSARCLGLADDREMARIGRGALMDEAVRTDSAEADAVFLSCTALPALGAIAGLEDRLGKPVVASNQASLWAMLGLAGLPEPPVGYGRLFRHPLPAAGG